MKIQRRLSTAARDWSSAPVESKADFLYTGARLAVASEWAAKHGEELSPDESAFLTESQAVERERKADEVSFWRRLTAVAAGATVVFIVIALIAWGERRHAQANASKAEDQERVARREADAAERTLSFLENMFELTDPYKAKGQTITVREILDQGAQKVNDLKGHPLDQAKLWGTIGNSYRSLAIYDCAERCLVKSLEIRQRVQGKEHPDIAQSLNNLAELLSARGDYAAAQPLYERALAIRKKVLGPEHLNTATSLDYLAGLLVKQGDYAAARPLYERALAIRERALGPEHPDIAQSLNNLAGLLVKQGDYAAAQPLYERALAIRERALGPEHLNTATSLDNLAGLLVKQGDYAAAQPLYERAWRSAKRCWARSTPTSPRASTT